MKKLLLSASVIFLAGCSGDDDTPTPHALIGTWHQELVTINGIDQPDSDCDASTLTITQGTYAFDFIWHDHYNTSPCEYDDLPGSLQEAGDTFWLSINDQDPGGLNLNIPSQDVRLQWPDANTLIIPVAVDVTENRVYRFVRE